MHIEPRKLIGTWRRFGPVGPVYEVIGTSPGSQDESPVMRIRVLETGEEVDYKMADVLDDPVER
jgi:hypothetical protein